MTRPARWTNTSHWYSTSGAPLDVAVGLARARGERGRGLGVSMQTMHKGHVARHMLPAEDWDRARTASEVRAGSLAAEGFIPRTGPSREPVAVGNRDYAGDPRPYVALLVDLGRVTAPWRYDDAARIYPHIYGPLNLDAVVGVVRLPRDGGGQFLERKETDVNA